MVGHSFYLHRSAAEWVRDAEEGLIAMGTLQGGASASRRQGSPVRSCTRDARPPYLQCGVQRCCLFFVAIFNQVLFLLLLI